MNHNDNKQITAPLRFRPAYKTTLWGGERIYKYKEEKAPADQIGETWEVSGMPGDESIVSDGPYTGQNLTDLTKKYGASLVGEHVFKKFGSHFPLLIKLIDANDDLSIQVHPGDEYATKNHGGKLGKTEMWYLLGCTPDAKIYAGWKKETDPVQIKEIVKTDEVLDYLMLHKPSQGDVFFLPAGKVHSIGAGCFVLEIQEASDLTYRLFDFNRTDSEGNKRELHVDRAAEVIDYQVDTTGTISYDRETKNELVTLKKCPYFHTSILRLTQLSFELPLADRDSFTVLFVEEGTVRVETTDGSLELSAGNMILIPAAQQKAILHLIGGSAKLVDCYIP